MFDERMEAEVKAFQATRGLEPDGVVGPATLEALNTTAEQRIRRIGVNLERWRWLPENLGDRYVLVNVADFKLEVIEQDRKVLEMKIIVGKSYRRSPVFSDRISYLVLNPRWHVPRNIAVKDKLPLIKKDPTYLAENRMKVFAGWGAETRELNPAQIDWSSVSAKNFPYRFRQEPGPRNALGQIKFMFPNRFNVYLHDTPSRELFDKNVRNFSSGCIRIQKPLDLAEYLLRGDPSWSRDKIQEELAKKRERTIKLPTPVPVHLLYWTAFVDDNKVLQFRNDIYGRDERLAKALKL
jgi:murein L,D-transpeptidase YcbB/YkuD